MGNNEYMKIEPTIRAFVLGRESGVAAIDLLLRLAGRSRRKRHSLSVLDVPRNGRRRFLQVLIQRVVDSLPIQRPTADLRLRGPTYASSIPIHILRVYVYLYIYLQIRELQLWLQISKMFIENPILVLENAISVRGFGGKRGRERDWSEAGSN